MHSGAPLSSHACTPKMAVAAWGVGRGPRILWNICAASTALFICANDCSREMALVPGSAAHAHSPLIHSTVVQKEAWEDGRRVFGVSGWEARRP